MATLKYFILDTVIFWSVLKQNIIGDSR